tara:strand:+ start:320 stop:1420 length:1101 start_codon:yes stop_codon:yes gene_type:complete
MENKNILLSQVVIPSNQIGSWNVMLTNLIKLDDSIFDVIICPKPSSNLKTINHLVVHNRSILNKLISKYKREYKYFKYWIKVKNLLKKEDKITLNIIDDVKLLMAINFFSKKAKLRERIQIYYYLHGYRFDLDIQLRNAIYSSIDKLILLTNKSYQSQIQENHTIPCEVDILRNGINSEIFYPLKKVEKKELRIKLNLKTNVKYFLWVSQDRPKKGLSIILKAWKKIIENHNDVELLIIGTHNEIKGQQITWLERKKNEELAVYYQSTDYYLFSTLCHEGHPLTLTEALKSGAKCLASDIDPVSEVMHNGDLGYLVKNPHFVENWVNAINDVLVNKINFNKNNIDLIKLYDEKDWIASFKEILNKE